MSRRTAAPNSFNELSQSRHNSLIQLAPATSKYPFANYECLNLFVLLLSSAAAPGVPRIQSLSLSGRLITLLELPGTPGDFDLGKFATTSSLSLSLSHTHTHTHTHFPSASLERREHVSLESGSKRLPTRSLVHISLSFTDRSTDVTNRPVKRPAIRLYVEDVV